MALEVLQMWWLLEHCLPTCSLMRHIHAGAAGIELLDKVCARHLAQHLQQRIRVPVCEEGPDTPGTEASVEGCPTTHGK